MKKKRQFQQQPDVETETTEREPLTLARAKEIVNDAVQPRSPGHERDPRPDLGLLTEAKSIVNAAVQPKSA